MLVPGIHHRVDDLTSRELTSCRFRCSNQFDSGDLVEGPTLSLSRDSLFALRQ